MLMFQYDSCFKVKDALQKFPAAMETMMARTSALQVMLLRSVDHPERQILVGNTHLYWRPDADHIRQVEWVSIKYLENPLFSLHFIIWWSTHQRRIKVVPPAQGN